MVDKPQAEQLKLTQLGKNPRPVLLEAKKKLPSLTAKGPHCSLLVPSSYRGFCQRGPKKRHSCLLCDGNRQANLNPNPPPYRWFLGQSPAQHADVLIGHFKMTEKLS